MIFWHYSVPPESSASSIGIATFVNQFPIIALSTPSSSSSTEYIYPSPGTSTNEPFQVGWVKLTLLPSIVDVSSESRANCPL